MLRAGNAALCWESGGFTPGIGLTSMSLPRIPTEDQKSSVGKRVPPSQQCLGRGCYLSNPAGGNHTIAHCYPTPALKLFGTDTVERQWLFTWNAACLGKGDDTKCIPSSISSFPMDRSYPISAITLQPNRRPRDAVHSFPFPPVQLQFKTWKTP